MSDVPKPELAAAPVPTRLFSAEQLILVALLALSLAGIAITDFSKGYGLWYWLAMVPIFAGASIFAGWSRARRKRRTVAGILWRQVLHWSALALAVYLVYLFAATGRVSNEDAGLIALLALALTTFLAGVHFDWRLLVLGALLGIAAACAALVEKFFWLLLVPAILAGALVVLWRRRAD